MNEAPLEKIHPVRQRQQPRGLGLHFLRKRAVRGERDHLVAGLRVLHASPTSLTTPASSLPGENGNGGLNWYLFWMISTSGN
jgi:hypothetical protein